MMKRLQLVADLVVLATVSWAQGDRATLGGTVLDASESVIPGAEISALNVATGVEYKTTTTATGAYTFAYMPPGTYTLTVTSPGFRTANLENVALRVAQTQTLNVVMQVGQVTESVTVSSEPPLLDSGSAEIGRYISSEEYDAWPIAVSDGQRQIQQFIFSSSVACRARQAALSRVPLTVASNTRTRFLSRA